MRWSPAAMAVATVLVVASCSGDDDTATTTAAPTTTDVAATAPPPTSTTPTTTTTTTTPVTTAEPVETTASPTTASTTVDADPRFAILDAVDAATNASLEAVRNPFDDTKLDALRGYFTGTLLEGWQNVVTNYREQNLRALENPAEADSFDVALASLAVNEAGNVATVQGCSVTAGIIVEVGGNPDGSDRVVEDRIARTVIEFDVVKDGGSWKLESVREPTDEERIASCE